MNLAHPRTLWEIQRRLNQLAFRLRVGNVQHPMADHITRCAEALGPHIKKDIQNLLDEVRELGT